MGDGQVEAGTTTATRQTPPIPGLYVFPGLLSEQVARIGENDIFSGGRRDQAMLFEAPRQEDPILGEREDSDLPRYILDLVHAVQQHLEDALPSPTFAMVFDQPLARQVIINLYPPGQGITPHIDLPHRYADGILGVSLCGGCVMVLRHVIWGQEHHVYLPPHSIYCLTGEARWDWSHGIEARRMDVVADQGRRVTLMRDLRVSVTFRWMKEGAGELVDAA